MADENKLAKSIARSLNMSKTGGKGKIAYFLDDEDSPSNTQYFISTGSTLLDTIIANKPNGGLPGGRIVEFYGESGCIHPDTELEVKIE